MSKLYGERPSSLLGLIDPYASYCFDEACAYIISRIKDGENPDFTVKDVDGPVEKPHYSKMSDLYKSMGYKNGDYKKSLK